MSKIQPLVDCSWLESQLHNSQVLIIDCRFRLSEPEWGRQQYCSGHIPGAYYLDLNQDLSAPVNIHGGRHPLPEKEKFAEKMASIGVEFAETLVIAYDDSHFAFAARLWWLLRYFGHDKVALLNGGWLAWQAGGFPIDNDIPKPQLSKFTPQVRPDWTVDIEVLKSRKDLPEVTLVDSRDGDRYRGEREPIDPIPGHIPGAINLPWREVTDSSGKLLPQDALQQRWLKQQPKKEIIVYCGSGVTACVNLLSLELAGISGAKLYPGGWSDWCSYLN